MTEAASKMHFFAEKVFAFPSEQKFSDGSSIFNLGMTLRDYFAGQALAGMLAGDMASAMAKVAELRGMESPDQAVAFEAYAVADAMLAERAKAPALREQDR